MIAFFLPDLERAFEASKHFPAPTREVDGPFRVFQSRMRGVDVMVYAVPGGVEPAYAAARIAVRRGAESLIAFVDAAWLPGGDFAEEAAVGQAYPVTAVWDLAGLAPLLRLLPDTAAAPAGLESALAKSSIWSDPQGEGVAIGTPPWAIGNDALRRALRKRLKLQALDAQSAGYAAAANDTQAVLQPIALMAGASGQGRSRGTELVLARAVEETLEAML